MSRTITTIISLGVVGEDNTVTIDQYKDRVLAVGAALLLAYVINFATQIAITCIKKQNKQASLKKLLETSQIMYWFGIASIFSFFPPFFYGAFNAVMSYITLIFVAGMHIACATPRKIKNRSVWSLMNFMYHLCLVSWMIVGFILACIWSDDVYDIHTS